MVGQRGRLFHEQTSVLAAALGSEWGYEEAAAWSSARKRPMRGWQGENREDAVTGSGDMREAGSPTDSSRALVPEYA